MLFSISSIFYILNLITYNLIWLNHSFTYFWIELFFIRIKKHIWQISFGFYLLSLHQWLPFNFRLKVLWSMITNLFESIIPIDLMSRFKSCMIKGYACQTGKFYSIKWFFIRPGLKVQSHLVWYSASRHQIENVIRRAIRCGVPGLSYLRSGSISIPLSINRVNFERKITHSQTIRWKTLVHLFTSLWAVQFSS